MDVDGDGSDSEMDEVAMFMEEEEARARGGAGGGLQAAAGGAGARAPKGSMVQTTLHAFVAGGGSAHPAGVLAAEAGGLNLGVGADAESVSMGLPADFSSEEDKERASSFLSDERSSTADSADRRRRPEKRSRADQGLAAGEGERLLTDDFVHTSDNLIQDVINALILRYNRIWPGAGDVASMFVLQDGEGRDRCGYICPDKAAARREFDHVFRSPGRQVSRSTLLSLLHHGSALTQAVSDKFGNQAVVVKSVIEAVAALCTPFRFAMVFMYGDFDGAAPVTMIPAPAGRTRDSAATRIEMLMRERLLGVPHMLLPLGKDDRWRTRLVEVQRLGVTGLVWAPRSLRPERQRHVAASFLLDGVCDVEDCYTTDTFFASATERQHPSDMPVRTSSKSVIETILYCGSSSNLLMGDMVAKYNIITPTSSIVLFPEGALVMPQVSFGSATRAEKLHTAVETMPRFVPYFVNEAGEDVWALTEEEMRGVHADGRAPCSLQEYVRAARERGVAAPDVNDEYLALVDDRVSTSAMFSSTEVPRVWCAGREEDAVPVYEILAFFRLVMQVLHRAVEKGFDLEKVDDALAEMERQGYVPRCFGPELLTMEILERWLPSDEIFAEFCPSLEFLHALQHDEDLPGGFRRRDPYSRRCFATLAGIYATNRQLRRHPTSMMLFAGVGGSGKSTQREMITRAIGEWKCSAVSIKPDDNFQFSAIPFDQLVVYDDEAPLHARGRGGAGAAEGLMKKIAEGATVSINAKGKDPVNARTCWNLVLCCNEDPRALGNSGGQMTRRLFTFVHTQAPEEKKEDVRASAAEVGQMRWIFTLYGEIYFLRYWLAEVRGREYDLKRDQQLFGGALARGDIWLEERTRNFGPILHRLLMRAGGRTTEDDVSREWKKDMGPRPTLKQLSGIARELAWRRFFADLNPEKGTRPPVLPKVVSDGVTEHIEGLHITPLVSDAEAAELSRFLGGGGGAGGAYPY